jgi:hypothetical protein
MTNGFKEEIRGYLRRIRLQFHNKPNQKSTEDVFEAPWITP